MCIFDFLLLIEYLYAFVNVSFNLSLFPYVSDIFIQLSPVYVHLLLYGYELMCVCALVYLLIFRFTLPIGVIQFIALELI